MTSPPAAGPGVRMRAIRKRFGAVQALDGADLELRPGEVHGVLGENGAGKTTLLRILAGQLEADQGVVEVDGRPVRPRSPREAWGLGIGMVHQHFALVPRLTVLENLVLGSRGSARGLGLPLASTRGRASELARRTGLSVDVDARVEDLGVGARQRVEILKVLLRDPAVLVLDEPTAVLAPAEVDGLLELLRLLAGEGRAVALVAHKLDEVLSVADRVTVLRGGRTVRDGAPRGEVDASGLARAMVGSGLERVVAGKAEEGLPPAVPRPAGTTVARLRDVGTGRSGGEALHGVDLEVRGGEIVGVAGVEGNGQRALARVLAGRAVPDSGTVELPPDPSYVPEDRTREGLVGSFDLVENLALALHRDPDFRTGPLLRWSRIRERTRVAVERFGIRAVSLRVPVATLSGGNQQRLVVARELDRHPSLLVAENPTRGLDVSATAFVHRSLLELRERAEPPGVVLISTDLDEVLRLSDRVFVVARGRLLPVPASRRSREGIGEIMLGGVSAGTSAP